MHIACTNLPCTWSICFELSAYQIIKQLVTPLPCTPLQPWNGGLCPTVFVISETDNPFNTVIVQVCRKGFEVLSQARSFFSFLYYFHHFLCVQPSSTPWIPLRRDCLKLCAIIHSCDSWSFPFVWKLAFRPDFESWHVEEFKAYWTWTWKSCPEYFCVHVSVKSFTTFAVYRHIKSAFYFS